MNKHFYVDVDDVLSETARELCGLSQRLFGKSCTYEEMYTFNLLTMSSPSTAAHSVETASVVIPIMSFFI